MGGAKKRAVRSWIDKRTAASFHLIHRPAAAAEDGELDQSHHSDLASLSLHSSSDRPPPSSSFSAPSRYLLQSSRPLQRLPEGFPSDLLVDSTDTAAALQGWMAEETRRRKKREREAMDVTALPHDYDYSAHLREMGGGVFVPGTGEAGELEVEGVLDARASTAVVEDALDAEVDWALVRRAEAEGRKRRQQRGAAAARLPADVLRALQEEDGDGAYGEEAAAEEAAEDDGDGEAAATAVELPAFDEMEDDFVLKAMRGSDQEQEGEGEEGSEGGEGEEWKQAELEEEDSGDGVHVADFERALRAFDAARLRQAMGEEKGKEGPTAMGETAHSRHAIAALPKRGGSLRDEKDGEEEEDDEEEEEGKEDGWWSGEEDGEDEEAEEGEGESGGVGVVGAAGGGAAASAGAALQGVELEFARLLAESYADDDIGGLDDAADEDDEDGEGKGGLAGPLPLSSFTATLDHFLDQHPQTTAEATAALALTAEERAEAQRRMQSRMRAMQREEEEGEQPADARRRGPVERQGEDDSGDREAEAEEWLLPAVYQRGPREQWDVQSVLSTRTNTENHPQAIVEDDSSAQSTGRAQQRQSSSAAAAALAHLINTSAQHMAAHTKQHGHADAVDEGEEEEEEEGETGARSQPNRGEARPRGESAEERRTRKTASKAEQRERRQRRRRIRGLDARAQ